VFGTEDWYDGRTSAAYFSGVMFIEIVNNNFARRIIWQL
jgi:hypothetical protein